MATAGSYAPTPDSSTRSGAQYMKEGAAQAPYGIDIPPTPMDEPSYSPHKGTRMFEDDKTGERACAFVHTAAGSGFPLSRFPTAIVHSWLQML